MKIYYEPVNLLQWNMFEKVKNCGHIEPFLATNSMEVGDLILLHVGKQSKQYKSGLYAIWEIISEPFILKDHPDDYCNNKKTVMVKIVKINYSIPFIAAEKFIKFSKQLRTVHIIDEQFNSEILNLIGK